jgi:hypothetical protein
MTTSPRLGYTELTAGQAVPETTVNEIDRYLEAFANGCHFKSRASNPAEPGSPADGDCYLLTGTPTGTHWAGHGGKIALYINTAWVFITAKEGFIAWVDDEDVVIAYNGATWASLGSAAGALLAANNLSDVVSAATSATNLGLGTANSPQFAGVNVGHASDTTITRAAAGDIAVEGNTVYRAGGTDVAVADGGTGASTAAAAATNLGLGTGDSPQFTAINIGHASDTTVTRTGAGDIAVEGNAIYRAGGTDVPVTDGGTGSSTASGARTNLGATTVGGNLFTLTNPSAITFLRVNADNTVDALSASSFRTAIGAGTGGGDLSGPASSVDNHVAIFDSTTGKLLKDGGVGILANGCTITPQATPATNEVGYLGCPQNTQNGTYTTVMSDAGKHIYHTSGSTHTWTIDSNANVAYPIGTILTFINENGGGNVTLAITSDTLRWGSSTGSRTLAANGTATAIKVASTTWRLTGDGIT